MIKALSWVVFGALGVWGLAFAFERVMTGPLMLYPGIPTGERERSYVLTAGGNRRVIDTADSAETLFV